MSSTKVDEKTMALQYLDTLRTVGSSPSTKFVVPMEIMNFVQQFGAIMSGNSNSGDGSGPNGASGD